MRKHLFLALILSATALLADDPIFHYLDKDGFEVCGSIACQKGQLEKVADLRTQGQTGYKLKPSKQGDNAFQGRIQKGLYVCTPQIWGQKYDIVLEARGKGTVKFAYTPSMMRESKIAPKLTYLKESADLSPEEWKTYTAEILCTEPGVWRLNFNAELNGDDQSYMEIASFNIKWHRPSQTISAYPKHIIAYPGMPLAADFTLEKDCAINVFDGKAFSSAKSSDGKFHIDATAGTATLGENDSATGIPDTGRIGICSEEDAAAADVFIHTISKEDWDAIDAIASKIKIDKPQRILFIADSLSDFDRGVNFVDKLEYWLNKNNPHKVSIHNAGIGGNYIEWVYNCVNGKSNYRSHMYAGLLDQHWDHIFIFLGQNDTRHHYRELIDKPDYQPVPEEKHAFYLKGALDTIRQKTQAKITLVSPISSNTEASARGAQYAKNKGREYVIFGEVDRVEAYYKTVEEVAKEYNLDYLDIYHPFKELPNKADMFTPDGVHLTLKGHTLFCTKLLEYLASSK